MLADDDDVDGVVAARLAVLPPQVLEDVVQRIIAMASSPPLFQNELGSVSSSELIKLIGADFSTRESISRMVVKPAQVGASLRVGSHAVPTVLLVQKRLSEEFRYLHGVAADTQEARMATLKRNYDEAEQAIRASHLQRLKHVLASDVGEVHAADTPHTTIKVQATASVELLERKLGDGEGDVRTKRLTTFWKARYDAAARKLSDEQQHLVATEARLAEQVQLNGSDPTALLQLLQTMRDAEAREKEKLVSIRSHYTRECQRQGITPQEVSESLAPPYGKGPEATAAHADAKTFTATGFKSSSVRLLAILLAEKMSQAASANAACAQLATTLGQLQHQLDIIQTRFCQTAGSAALANSIGSGKLLEEIVNLRAEVELREAHGYSAERRALLEACCQRQRISQLRMALESSRCKHKAHMLGRAKELSDLDMQLFHIRHATGGSGDCFGGTLPDVQLLHSKLMVLENELKLLKTERNDLSTLAAHMKLAVDQRERSPK